jgi:formyl-CoA transferase
LTRTLNHPNLGALRQVVTPIFSDAAPTELQRPPPLLGEHSVEILQQAGFDPASIQALLNSHVILQATHPEHATGVAP